MTLDKEGLIGNVERAAGAIFRVSPILVDVLRASTACTATRFATGALGSSAGGGEVSLLSLGSVLVSRTSSTAEFPDARVDFSGEGDSEFPEGGRRAQQEPCKLINIGVKNHVLYLQGREPVDDETPAAAFERMSDMLENDEPAFVLVRVDKYSNTPHWALLYWLPKKTTQDQLLLYANARRTLDDIIANTPAAPFVETFVCKEKSDLSYQSYLDSQARYPVAAKPHTQPELRIFTQALARRTASTGADTTPIGPSSSLPLEPTSSCKRLIRAFANVKEHCLMLTLDSKTGSLSAEASPQTSLVSIATRIYAREPRYYVIRHLATSRSSAIFFLSSPDGSSKFLRVVYASYKAAVLALLEGEGIKIRTSLDVRNATTDLSDMAVQSAPDRLPVSSTGRLGGAVSVGVDTMYAGMRIKPRPPLTRPIGDVFTRLRAAGGLEAPVALSGFADSELPLVPN